MPTANDAPTPAFVLLQQSQYFVNDGPCNCSINKTYILQPEGRDGRYKQRSSELYDKYATEQTWNYHYKSRRRRKTNSFREVGGLKQVTTNFQIGSRNIIGYTYSQNDPCQHVLIINTHPDENAQIKLEYDDNGCLIRD